MDINNQKRNGRVRARQQPVLYSLDGFVRPAPRPRPAVPATEERPAALIAVAATKPTTSQANKSANTVVDVPKKNARKGVRDSTPLSTKLVKRSAHPLRKWLVRSFAMVLILVLATGGFLSWKGYTKLHKVFRGTTTVAALASKTVDPDLLKGEGDGRVNILLLGVGGAGHDGPDLTDTLLILSVDPVNNTAALLSIPRDLWVKMPVNYFGAYQKINAAYESGKYHFLGKLDPSNSNADAVQAGFNSIDTVVSQVAGITINYHVLVNFQAFRQAIDTVGGVTVTVAEQLYDPTMAWENNWNPVLAPVGTQVMDGKKALLYARSRETSSDFARTERQRQIMLALKDKVLTADTLSNPAKIEGLMNAFGDNVYSDLSTGGAQRLYSIIKKIDNAKIASIGLATAPNNFVTTDHVGNISVVRPRAGFDKYTDIQMYIRSQLPDGYILKEHAPISVLGATNVGATATATELKSYGYSVVATSLTTITPSAATTSTITSGTNVGTLVVDLSGGQDKYTLNYLQKRYDVTALTKLPPGVPAQPADTKFVIITSK